jgi:tetratricopeptide (TPR) repeat protein
LSGEDKNPEAAYDVIMAAREDYPSDKILAEYEIQLLLQLNKMDEAMAQIKEALANDPNNTSILLRSGYLKEQSGDVDGALADYKKSVEVDPNFYEGNYYAGALLLEKSRGILAELNSLSDDEWEKRSASMGEEANQHYAEAVTYFEKSLELKPEDTDIMGILYQIHTRLKNEAEAEKYNNKLVELLGPNWQDN